MHTRQTSIVLNLTAKFLAKGELVRNDYCYVYSLTFGSSVRSINLGLIVRTNPV